MKEPEGTQDNPEKPATVQRKRRRLYESLPAEEEKAFTLAIEEHKVGENVPAGGRSVDQSRAPKPPDRAKDSDSLERDREAWDIIEKYIYKVGANAMIPIPVIDLAAVILKQTEMLRKLAETYDVDYDEYLAMDVVRKVWRAYNGFTMGAIVLGSAAKVVPILGSVVGMGPVSFSAAASTYALGKLAVEENRRTD
ncbi:YcjF family protein [Gammaproteobacteria bacterium]|nr:YcjF family protein [Gammaproteobacteria bacterium]